MVRRLLAALMVATCLLAGCVQPEPVDGITQPTSPSREARDSSSNPDPGNAGQSRVPRDAASSSSSQSPQSPPSSSGTSDSTSSTGTPDSQSRTSSETSSSSPTTTQTSQTSSPSSASTTSSSSPPPVPHVHVQSVVPSHSSATIIVTASAPTRVWIQWRMQDLQQNTTPIEHTGSMEHLIPFLQSETSYQFQAVYETPQGLHSTATSTFMTLSNPHRWANVADALIQPGMLIRTEKGHCTLAFIFQDQTNETLYGLTAGHCFRPEDGAVWFQNGTRFGEAVYKQTCSPCAPEDVALVAIDTAYRPFVSPSVSYWGGPTALPVDQSVERGDTVCYFGHGAVVRPGGEVQNHRCARITGFDNVDGTSESQLVNFNGHVQGGDSGGPLLDYATGAAIGHMISGYPGLATGLTVCHAIKQAGIPVQLATAPFNPPPAEPSTPPMVEDSLSHVYRACPLA